MEDKEFGQLTPEEKKARFQKAVDDYNSGFVEVDYTFRSVASIRVEEDGYLEGNGYIVSWCVGHLVELASPESYDEKYEKWRYDDLPILPSQWNYQIAAATRKQFSILKKLMEREDVTGLVEATEVG